jgi:glycosyltransferase involved in cell wall biosynthesis
MKIAFVTTYNANDINSWSGTPYFMAKSLIDAGVDVEFIGELESLPRASFSSRIKEAFYHRLLKGKLGKFILDYEPEYLKYYALQVQRRLKNSNADIVFSPGAIALAYLSTNKPVVMWSDATFAVMHNYYDGYADFSYSSIRSCHLYEKNVIKRLSLAIFSSEWAAQSAIKCYGAKESKTKVIPYGANILSNKTIKDIIEINSKKSRKICKLLFIGRDWIRKGGPVAVKIAQEMNNQGIKTELVVVGCNPAESSSLPVFVKILGFVDKSKNEGANLIDNLYRESHFFVLPTIADCTPIVFSESNSYGVPVITTNTGGIPSIIKDDINGKMFDVNFDVKKCAGYIGNIFSDFEKYEEFSINAFAQYNKELNWKVSIARIIKYLEEILDN